MSFDPIVYRTDDLTKWGFGQGSDLDAVTIDNNFWNCDDRLTALEASALGKTINYIAESNGALFVHYSDHTIDGPFPIPVAAFNYRGAWTATTAYAINDIVLFGGGLYLAVLNFTSLSTFTVNDGSGHTWLVLMLQLPAIPVTTVTASTYLLTIADSNTYIRFTNTTGCAVSIDTFANQGWAAFTEIHLRDESLDSPGGGVTVVGVSPVVINGVGGRLDQTAAKGGTLFLKNVATDSWDIGGMQALVEGMPTENARKRARKLVKLPSGDQMYVPVITEIDFIDLVGDPSAQAVRWAVGQEFDYKVDNTAQSGRTVHVDQVNTVTVDVDGAPTSDPPSVDTSQTLYVERIDTWPVVSVVERGQEFDFNPDNKTGNDLQPPHFKTHDKTHIYRYYQDPNNPNDDGVWIDSELIDSWGFVDTVNRGQESDFSLNNQTNAQFRSGDLSGQADPSDPDITIGDGSGEGMQDNPVRLDPFQNIVNFSAKPVFVDFVYDRAYEIFTLPPPLTGPATILVSPGFAFDQGYATTMRLALGSINYFNFPQDTNNFHISGTPIPSNVSFAEWECLEGAWVQPGTQGGADKVFTSAAGATSLTATVPLWAVAIDSSQGIGFYSDVSVGDPGGIKAGGISPGTLSFPSSAIGETCTVSVNLTGITATYNGSDPNFPTNWKAKTPTTITRPTSITFTAFNENFGNAAQTLAIRVYFEPI